MLIEHSHSQWVNGNVAVIFSRTKCLETKLRKIEEYSALLLPVANFPTYAAILQILQNEMLKSCLKRLCIFFTQVPEVIRHFWR